MSTVWVVVDVGSIECGEPTEIIGVYGSAEDARRYAEKRAAEFEETFDTDSNYCTYFRGGQHSIEIHSCSDFSKEAA